MLFVPHPCTQNNVGDSIITNLQGEIQLDCYRYSRTTSSLQWYKDGSMLNDTTRITGTSTNRLSITNVIDSDFGVYQCYVEDFYSRATPLTGMFKKLNNYYKQARPLAALAPRRVAQWPTQTIHHHFGDCSWVTLPGYSADLVCAVGH